jgi:uncharacterized damage-inducible protein DinB
MGEGGPELAPLAQWDPGVYMPPPVAQVEELVAGFESTWRLIHLVLDRWTVADLDRAFSPPNSLSEADRSLFGEERTLQWILWHVHEHEIHHGGELSLALGGLGVQGVYDDV